MKHKRIHKKLVLFLDSELPDQEMDEIRQHLEQCSLCSKHLGKIDNVWIDETRAMRLEPPTYMWTQVDTRIQEYERNQHIFASFFDQGVGLVRPVVTLLVAAMGILIGIYLGNIPTASNNQSAVTQSSGQERFYNSIYLDSFRDLPPESIGGVYVTLASKENGGSQ